MKKPYGYKKAIFCFVPIYYNPDTNDMIGRGWITDKLIDLAIPCYSVFLFIVSFFCALIGIDDYDPTFRIKYKEDKKE